MKRTEVIAWLEASGWTKPYNIECEYISKYELFRITLGDRALNVWMIAKGKDAVPKFIGRGYYSALRRDTKSGLILGIKGPKRFYL